MRPVAMSPAVGPRMPMYPPGAPGLGQQLFYGQGPPIIPPQVIDSFFNQLFVFSALFQLFKATDSCFIFCSPFYG